MQQFTELRKNYETLETSEPGTSIDPMLENGHRDSSCRHVEVLGDTGLAQNNYRELRNNITSSGGLNLYNSTNGEVGSSVNCLLSYNNVTETLQRRQCGSTQQMSNFIPRLNTSDVGLTKRACFSDAPPFPPPPYSDHNFQRLNSLPIKRAKTEEGFYQLRPQSTPAEPPVSEIHAPHFFEIGRSQHCAPHSSHPFESHAVSNGEAFKNLAPPLISPIQARSSHNKKRTRKPVKKTNKMSETVVTGFPFDFEEANLDFEKPCFEPQAQA